MGKKKKVFHLSTPGPRTQEISKCNPNKKGERRVDFVGLQSCHLIIHYLVVLSLGRLPRLLCVGPSLALIATFYQRVLAQVIFFKKRPWSLEYYIPHAQAPPTHDVQYHLI